MPDVIVRITRGDGTVDRKARIVAEIVATRQRLPDKEPEHTRIIIDEVDPEDRGFAGVLIPGYHRRPRASTDA